MEMERVTVPRDWCHWERVPRATGMMVGVQFTTRHRTHTQAHRHRFELHVFDVRRKTGVSMQWRGGVAGQRCDRHPHRHSLHHLLCTLPDFWIPAQVSTPFHLFLPKQQRESSLIFPVFEAFFAVKGLRAAGLYQETEQDTMASRTEWSTCEWILRCRYKHKCVSSITVIHPIPHSSLRLFRMIPSQIPELILIFSLCCCARRSVHHSVRWSSSTRQVHRAKALANTGP